MPPIRPRARSVTVLGDWQVQVSFTDGTTADIDLEPFLRGPVFKEIRHDPHVFAQVRVAEVGGCLEWPNGADVDPDVLYDYATSTGQPLGSTGRA